MAAHIGILGPIGGLYGRYIEQEIMCSQGPLISQQKFEYSVTTAKYVLKASLMTSIPEKEESVNDSA